MREREGGELLREGAMEGGRDGDGGRDRDTKKTQKTPQNYYLLQRSDICQMFPPSGNEKRGRPMRSGEGPARFSITGFFFFWEEEIGLHLLLLLLLF